jgi:hypothetical protein
MDFSYGSYFGLLDRLKSRFAIRPLKDFGPPGLYLRHDIDVCLEAALRLAEEEHRHGVASTYMFIPTSPLYELSDGLRAFVELGHEVAIHFDYLTSGIADPADTAEMGAAIARQCALIEGFTGDPVRSLSFHRPIPQFLRGPDMLFGMVNAYSATLMQNYRSDSAGRWRQDPSDIQGPFAQLLTHPIWWGEDHAEPKDRIGHLDRALLAETIPGVF